MRFFSINRKFSARIMLLIVSVSLSISCLTAVVIGLLSRHELQLRIGNSLADLSFQMADKLDRGMFERLREIELMSRSKLMRDANAPIYDKQDALEDAKRNMPAHAWLAITDSKGVVLAATGGHLVGMDISARPWFAPSTQGAYIGDVHGALLLAKHLPAPPDGNLRFVDVAAPLFGTSGELLGVLCSHLTWEWAREVENSLFRNLKVRENIELFVFNKDGAPVLVPSGTTAEAWPKLTQLLGGTPTGVGSALAEWPDGRYLTGYAQTDGHQSYRGLGWVVVARQRAEVAFAPARALFFQALGFGAFFGAVASLIGGLISRRLATPLRQIADAADAIRRDALDAAIPIIREPEELASLSLSLRALVSELQEKNNALLAATLTLEDKVRERTAALSKSQALLSQTQRLGRMGGWRIELGTGERSWTSEMHFLFGLEEDHVPELSEWAELYAAEDRPRFLQAFNAAAVTGEPFDLELQLVESGGAKRWMRILGESEDGKSGRILSGMVQDITDRKNLESLREDVERIMHHDLKNPLNGIIGLPQIMVDEPNIYEEQRELLQEIEASGRRMLSMINNSLDLFKMERGSYKYAPVPVDLLAVIRKAVADLKSLLEAKSIKPRVMLGCTLSGRHDTFIVLGEELLCYSVFANLIRNAAEASPPGEIIDISLFQDKDCRAAIRNTGETPSEIRSVFFEKYATSGKSKGTGIGTYSAQLMAKAMGGHIELDASTHGFTSVIVHLPRHANNMAPYDS